MSADNDIYRFGGFSVTKTHINFGTTTLAMRNVSSVRTRRIPADRFAPTAALGGGVLAIVLAMVAFAHGGDSLTAGLILLVIGGGLVGAGARSYLRAKPTHVLYVTTNAGEVKALSDVDHTPIGQAADAIRRAMAAH